MTGPACTCDDNRFFVTHQIGTEPHYAGCPRWGTSKSTPRPAYRVRHQGWCHAEAHARCCNLDATDTDDCDCGAAEAQAEIDALADTVEVHRRALDRIEGYVETAAHLAAHQDVKTVAAYVLDAIRGAR